MIEEAKKFLAHCLRDESRSDGPDVKVLDVEFSLVKRTSTVRFLMPRVHHGDQFWGFSVFIPHVEFVDTLTDLPRQLHERKSLVRRRLVFEYISSQV